MTNLTVTVEQKVPVKYLKASMGVRYWEDATIDGVEDDDDKPKMPFSSGNGWDIIIDLETGKIDGWPEGVVAETHYKVCDAGLYALLDIEGVKITERDWYVPSMLSPGGEGYGDYVIMKIDGTGQIENWSADLSYFEENDG